MFGVNDNWNGSGFQNNWYPSTAGMPQGMNTNVLRVTSLDEAIMKNNARGSEMVYFNQGKDEFYNIRVDANGNKTWQVFTYSIPNPNVNMPVSRADFDALVVRFDALENKLKETKHELDGQSAVQ